MKLKLVYFTFVSIGADSNGGAICCRNHIKRLSADTGIELSVVIAGSQDQEADSLAYLISLGISGKFIAFRDVSPMIPVTVAQRIVPIQWEIFAHYQKHVDQELCGFIASTGARVLLVEFLYSAMFCPTAIKAAPKSVLVTLNRETEMYRDWLKRTREPRFKKAMKVGRTWLAEQAIFRSMDRVIALSAQDTPMRKGTHITPYLDRRARQWMPNSSRTVFFVGNIGHPPNEEAIEYIITKLAPAVTTILTDVRFKIIGASPGDVPFHHPSVDLLGKSDPSEVEQCFLSCQLFICPVRNTFGMKFKIAEALAYGTPFLASPESMLCVPYLDSRLALSLDDPIQAAHNIAAILLDESKTSSLAIDIAARYRQFIEAQNNIWSRSLRDL